MIPAFFGGIPPVKYVYLYPNPIPMNWGATKVTRLCLEDMGIDPRLGGVFLFHNRKKDQMKIFFLDDTGAQELLRFLPKGGFLVPVAKSGEKYIKIERTKLESLMKC
jgi:hypothetical protein